MFKIDLFQELNKALFNPDRGIDRVVACDVAIEQDRTFGPFVKAENFYSPAPPKSHSKSVLDLISIHTNI